jgi:hypothetical protein
MKQTQKNQKILGGILGFFRILYGLTWMVAGFTLLLCLIVPFTPDVRDEFCMLPINFSLQEGTVSVEVGGEDLPATLERTSGEVRIQGGPLLLSYATLFFSLVILAVVLYCTKLTIRIVRRIQEGKTFLLENATALRRIALASLLLFVFLLLSRIGYGIYASGRILSDSIVHTGFLGPRFEMSLAELAVPLFLLALAEAFRAGVLMQEDRDLTV